MYNLYDISAREEIWIFQFYFIILQLKYNWWRLSSAFVNQWQGCLQLEYLPEKSNARKLPVIFLEN